MDARPNSLDASLRARAARVVPGGMWGHMNAASLPEGYPQFFARAQGSRIWDVDGREYADFMCSWGPIIMGHHHPEIEDAVARQRAMGDCMNGPGEVMVELAELLVDTIPAADWIQFSKNGTDATTACVTIARAATGRRKILLARGAYHGAVPWCSPSLAGVTTEDRAHILHFDYNDIPSFESAIDQAGDDLAAVLASAFRHDIARDQEMPTLAFAQALRAACTTKDAALILDDVRAGFRLHSGGSWETIGIRPDMSAWSKAIGNGFPLAAITGTDRFRQAATKVYSTGSFWCATTSMAAAIATQNLLREHNGVAHMTRLGTNLREGLQTLSEKHGHPIRQTGPVQMPMVLFENDPDFTKGNAFCAEALRHGAYFHPRHNMFLSVAHTDADIALALSAAEAGFKALRP